MGDAPSRPERLEQIPAKEPIGQVTADGAYNTRACHAAIAAGAKPWPSSPHPLATDSTDQESLPGAQARSKILLASRRLGWAIRRTWSDYHQRSLIKAKMRCPKLLGERLIARTSRRPTAELQIQAARPNRFTALGAAQTERVA